MKKTAQSRGALRKDGMPVGDPFPPGKSGNPGGRPKGWAEFEAKCREHSDEAIDVLINLLRTGEERTQLEAAKTVLDRAWGKAKQQIEHKGNLSVSQLSDEELKSALMDAAKEIKRGR